MKKSLFLTLVFVGAVHTLSAANDGGLWQWVRNWWYAPAVDPVELAIVQDVKMAKGNLSQSTGQAQKKGRAQIVDKTKTPFPDDASGEQQKTLDVSDYKGAFVAMFYFAANPYNKTDAGDGAKRYESLVAFLAGPMESEIGGIKKFVLKAFSLFSSAARDAIFRIVQNKKLESFKDDIQKEVVAAFEKEGNPLSRELDIIRGATNELVNLDMLNKNEAIDIVLKMANKFKGEPDVIAPAAVLYAYLSAWGLQDISKTENGIVEVIDRIISRPDWGKSVWGATTQERIKNATYFIKGQWGEIQNRELFKPYLDLLTPEELLRTAVYDSRYKIIEGPSSFTKSFNDIVIQSSGLIQLYETGKRSNWWSDVDGFKKIVTDWESFKREKGDSIKTQEKLDLLRTDPSLKLHALLREYKVDEKYIDNVIEHIKSNQDWGKVDRERLKNAGYFVDGKSDKLQKLDFFKPYLDLLTPQDLLDLMSFDSRMEVLTGKLSFADAVAKSSGLIQLYQEGKKNNLWTDVQEFKNEVANWADFKGKPADSSEVNNILQKLNKIFGDAIGIVDKAYMSLTDKREALSSIAKDNIVRALRFVVDADKQLRLLEETNPQEAYSLAAKRIAALSGTIAGSSLFDSLFMSKAFLTPDDFDRLARLAAREEFIKDAIIEQWIASAEVLEEDDETLSDLSGSSEMVRRIEQKLRVLSPNEMKEIEIIADGFKKMLVDLHLNFKDVIKRVLDPKPEYFEPIYDSLRAQRSVQDAARKLAQKFMDDKKQDSRYWSNMSDSSYLELFVRYQTLMGDESTWDKLKNWTDRPLGTITEIKLDEARLIINPNPSEDGIVSYINDMIIEAGSGEATLDLNSTTVVRDIQQKLESIYPQVTREQWQEYFSQGNVVGQAIDSIKKDLEFANKIKLLQDRVFDYKAPTNPDEYQARLSEEASKQGISLDSMALERHINAVKTLDFKEYPFNRTQMVEQFDKSMKDAFEQAQREKDLAKRREFDARERHARINKHAVEREAERGK